MAPQKLPSITINGLNTPKSAPPAPGAPPASQVLAAALANATQLPGEKSCYLCDEQNPGDFSPTTKFLDDCLLCTRSFCPIHKGSWDHCCNINHSTYYHEHQHLPDVYPSLGEREKALFTSPVTMNEGMFPSTFCHLCQSVSRYS